MAQVSVNPSFNQYGMALVASARNEEQYRRLSEMNGGGGANAKWSYKSDMAKLKFEKEKWAKQLPLIEKEMDLKEVESWLAKSVNYLQARSQAASQRIAAQANVFQAGNMNIGSQQGISQQITGPGQSAGSSSASGKSISMKINPSNGQLIAVPEQFGTSDRSYSGNPYFSALFPSVGSQNTLEGKMQAADQWHAMSRSTGMTSGQLRRIDDTYKSELARIDEVFGISQGWKPRLFSESVAPGWQAPAQTPAVAQNPLTGTTARV